MGQGSTLTAVINGGYCIGCGACAVNEPLIELVKNDYGLFEARIGREESWEDAQVCPFSARLNEDELGAQLYGHIHGVRHEKHVGYYLNTYAGYTQVEQVRQNASSGGVTTWLLDALMKHGEIDIVLHVGSSTTREELFEYQISYSSDDIKNRSKSRYYPVHFDKVLETVLSLKAKRIAFVGIPCYIKALRLLCKKHPDLNERIAYTFAIFCGHLKSTAFAEMLGWQQGVDPNKLTDVNFRVKSNSRPASQYGVQVQDNDYAPPPTLARALYGTDWGLGYFKPKACDWCDDVAGETADVVCGDAWLPEFVNDPKGTNVVIVRNPKLLELIQEGRMNGQLELKEISFQKIIESQAGNYRHRHEGLAVRIENANSQGLWHPTKRIVPENYQVTEHRRQIYLIRSQISEKSHGAFYEAKQQGKLWIFVAKMFPLEIKYYYLNKRLLRSLVKLFLVIPKLFKKTICPVKNSS